MSPSCLGLTNTTIQGGDNGLNIITRVNAPYRLEKSDSSKSDYVSVVVLVINQTLAKWSTYSRLDRTLGAMRSEILVSCMCRLKGSPLIGIYGLVMARAQPARQPTMYVFGGLNVAPGYLPHGGSSTSPGPSWAGVGTTGAKVGTSCSMPGFAQPLLRPLEWETLKTHISTGSSQVLPYVDPISGL